MRKKNIFELNSNEPFKLSRSKVDLFLKCPRCFYLDRKYGVSQPSGAPYTLNNKIDALLKKEFDLYRDLKKVHPFVESEGISAIPFTHECLPRWRNNREGIQHLDLNTNFLLFGAVDDIWIHPSGELSIVDYKAKATTGEISLEPKRRKSGKIIKTDRYLIGYQKQMEFYQWLFRMNGFNVSSTGYFVFANAQKDELKFEDKLMFDKVLISHKGDVSWIEPTIQAIADCLKSDILPQAGCECDYCHYREKAAIFEAC